VNSTPEQKARDNIDKMLEQAGWAVVDKNAINWSLGPGLAVREYQTDFFPSSSGNPERMDKAANEPAAAAAAVARIAD